MKRLSYRPIADAEGFLQWIEDLHGKSGVYVIRRSATHEVLYVGESHSGRLRNTLKRHFWRWKDSQQRIHHCYARSSCEAAVRLTSAARAPAYQNALIRKLDPRDNGNGWGEDAAPF
jgi:excinuclease UvrABC nuclease subunit